MPASGVGVQGLSGCGSLALEPVVMAKGLSCSVARGIFLDQSSNLCLLHWQEDSLPLGC